MQPQYSGPPFTPLHAGTDAADENVGCAGQVTIGLLVHRDNHHVLAGPCPSPQEARRLVFELEYPDPLREPWPQRATWSILRKAYRDRLQWAVVVGSREACGEPVRELLKELAARNVHPSEVDGIEAGGQAAV